MFCKNCGTKLTDESKFCQKCGTPVYMQEAQSNINLYQSQPVQQAHLNQAAGSQTYNAASYQPQTNQYYPPGTHPYQTLGGYLKVLVIGGLISGILFPIMNLPLLILYINVFKYIDQIGIYASNLKAFLIFGLFGMILILGSVSYFMISLSNRIKRKDPNFLKFIQYFQTIFFIISFVFLLIFWIWAKSLDTYAIMNYSYIITNMVPVGLGWISGMVFTYIYFGQSVRVRTYMGSDEYLKRSVFNKKSHPIPAVPDHQPVNNVF